MTSVEALGLTANQWRFLASPERYVLASRDSERPLDPASTRRQFRTARDILERLNGSHRRSPARGVLLADDVGLGKTTVAALVAWVVASAGWGGRVRVLAPNEVMARRWEEELKLHVPLLKTCAPALAEAVSEPRIKARRTERLAAGSIQVVKHSYAREATLACDLLIVDEAHRAKGEKTAFSTALRRQRRNAKRVLILTATPFSIHLEELARMLRLVGGEAAIGPVRAFSKALDNLYTGDTSRDPQVVADRLAARAIAAVEALSECVIRHGVDDLPRERASFGDREEWQISVPPAGAGELEIILRMDRALRLARADKPDAPKQTNDARFHVGWRHLDDVRAHLATSKLAEPAASLVGAHLSAINSSRACSQVHPKTAATGDTVKSLVDSGERVVLFCHHHATAQELTLHLNTVLRDHPVPRSPSVGKWQAAWLSVLPEADNTTAATHLHAFVGWLCSPMIRAQTWQWVSDDVGSSADLAAAIEASSANGEERVWRIGDEARRLFGALCRSRSGRAVLREAAYRPEVLPGGPGSSRVLGICEHDGGERNESLFMPNRQPDTAIAVFNSPFGPDVLVVTDRLSEGIDLHRYCRHMVHYELDPSPIRTVQRNGRIRRVNSWAAVTGKPIRYAYPAFGGTRDHRLVQIMKKRIDSFSLLLGGVQDFDLEQLHDSDERWRNEVVALAKKRLARAGRRLRAR